MKKCLFLTLALVLVSSAVAAQAPPLGYIGLFTDEARTSWCATGVGDYWSLTMYIYMLPGENGQMCGEFAIDYGGDPGIIKLGPTEAPHVSVALGGLETGMSVCFSSCQTAWHWAFTQQMFVNTANKVEISVVGHPDVGLTPTFQFASCLEDFPTEPCIRLNSLYINSEDGVDPECSTLGTAPASWGAIKSLYDN